jgi:hypothetical protein
MFPRFGLLVLPQDNDIAILVIQLVRTIRLDVIVITSLLRWRMEVTSSEVMVSAGDRSSDVLREGSNVGFTGERGPFVALVAFDNEVVVHGAEVLCGRLIGDFAVLIRLQQLLKV